jgi:hypothetical protein
VTASNVVVSSICSITKSFVFLIRILIYLLISCRNKPPPKKVTDVTKLLDYYIALAKEDSMPKEPKPQGWKPS